MKCLIIGGNRFVGLRVSHALDTRPGVELHVLNRTGQVAHTKNAVVHKGDRSALDSSYVDKEWDVVIDMACFNQKDAESALQHFTSVGKYIFISTVSVYDSGADLREEAFRPEAYDLNQAPLADPDRAYQTGKRRAEAVFAQRAEFPVLSVRFPFILGPDDYTHRLDFHVERTLRGEPIFIERKEARVSMIHSEDAGRFLLWSMDRDLKGPLNVAAAEPISIGAMLAQIELVTGKKPILAKQATDDNRSPYSIDEDCFYNTGRLNGAGFKARPIAEWLPALIGPPEAGGKPKYVH